MSVFLGKVNQVILQSKFIDSIPPTFNFTEFRKAYTSTESSYEKSCVFKDWDITIKLTSKLTLTLFIKSISIEYCLTDTGLEEISNFLFFLLTPLLHFTPHFTPLKIVNVQYSLPFSSLPSLRGFYKKEPEIIKKILDFFRDFPSFKCVDEESAVISISYKNIAARLNSKSLNIVSNNIIHIYDFLINLSNLLEPSFPEPPEIGLDYLENIIDEIFEEQHHIEIPDEAEIVEIDDILAQLPPTSCRIEQHG